MITRKKSNSSSKNNTVQASSNNTAQKSNVKRSRSNKKTTLCACIDVGYGNQLYIRGEGAGLSWDNGKPMTYDQNQRWTWSTQKNDKQIEFKVLINDQVWCQGDNEKVDCGKKYEWTPSFY